MNIIITVKTVLFKGKTPPLSEKWVQLPKGAENPPLLALFFYIKFLFIRYQALACKTWSFPGLASTA